MKALYAARIKDLGPGDVVQIECACGHTEELTAAKLSAAGVKPVDKLADLGLRLRCRKCDGRGKPVVWIRWGYLNLWFLNLWWF
jgi:hypothetical protein